MASFNKFKTKLADDLAPQLAATLNSSGNQVRLSKGTDIASASVLVVPSNGNYFDVTGTEPVTSISATAIGNVIKLHFDASLPLTYHPTDLILPGRQDIVTAAGDEAELFEYATGGHRCTIYTRADGTSVVGGSDPALEARVTVLEVDMATVKGALGL